MVEHDDNTLGRAPISNISSFFTRVPYYISYMDVMRLLVAKHDVVKDKTSLPLQIDREAQ